MIISQGAEAKILLIENLPAHSGSQIDKKNIKNNSSITKNAKDFSSLTKFRRSDLTESATEQINPEEESRFVIKDRIRKSYRLPVLDEKIRKQRTRSEAKILEKLSKIILVPKIIKLDESEKRITMEFIQGEKLSNCLEKLPYKEICLQIGEEISKIHSVGIIHGDLTTSNMILLDNSNKLPAHSRSQINKDSINKEINFNTTNLKNPLSITKSSTKHRDEVRCGANNQIFFIDFGLSFHSHKIEDKAVDLHLLKQALEAKHFTIWKEAFSKILQGYNNKEVEKQLEKVEKRGRYKH